MINLDDYLDITIDFKLNGEVLNIKQPTAAMTKEIAKLEKSIDEENYLDINCKITKIILNNNKNGKKFTDEDVEKIPCKLQTFIATKIAELKYEVEHDPN